MNVAVKDAHQLTRASQSANILLALKLKYSEQLKETLFQFNFHSR